jgi:hypothetical protein
MVSLLSHLVLESLFITGSYTSAQHAAPNTGTNVSRLNTYLSKINIVDTDRYECGITETVPHFLFACPRWKNERRAMEAAHGNRYWELSYALGEYSTAERDGKKRDGEKNKWQPDWSAIKATIEYAIKTGRLQRQI